MIGYGTTDVQALVAYSPVIPRGRRFATDHPFLLFTSVHNIFQAAFWGGGRERKRFL